MTRRALDYDPQVPSDGLTVDTPQGPVDLVAVARKLDGRPVELTWAERKYAAALRRQRQAVRAATRTAA